MDVAGVVPSWIHEGASVMADEMEQPRMLNTPAPVPPRSVKLAEDGEIASAVHGEAD